MRHATAVTLSLAGLALLLASCGPPAGVQPILERRVLPAARPEQKVAADTRMRFMQQPADPHAGHGHAPGEGHGSQEPPAALDYEPPPEWQEVAATNLRAVNFVVPGTEVECYVTILPGGGGSVSDNVNRWRKQMGLGPAAEADVAACPKIRVMGADAPYVEMEGTYQGAGGVPPRQGSTMGATMVVVDGVGYTVKIVGPTDVVTPELERFKTFCASLSLPKEPAVAAPPTPPAPSPAGFDASRLTWTLPSGWTQGPAKQMRLATFNPSGGGGAECYITVLGGDGGGLAPNVNRWRSQLALAPLSAADLDALEKVPALGVDGRFVEIDGGAQGVLGVVCELGAQAVFVKMTGPMETLRRERESFLSFVRSMK